LQEFTGLLLRKNKLIQNIYKVFLSPIHMKRGLLIGFILGLFLISFVSADFSVGNLSHSITKDYGSGELLSGWFNISLINEPANSILTAFESNINIFDFLELNNADYYCVPQNCEKGYKIVGDAAASKSIGDVYPTEWLVGMKLNGQISGITSLSFDIATDVKKSCLNPMKIDIGDDEYFEWVASEVTNEICDFPGAFGCFKDKNTSKIDLKDNKYYCEEIELPPFKSFNIGAIVNGVGDAEFEMLLDVAGEEIDCTALTNKSGEISCRVDLDKSLIQPTTGEVCIKGSEYKIKFEDDNTCGSVKDNNLNMIPDSEHDFEIFAKPLKYAGVNDFVFNQELLGDIENINLAGTVWNYIDDNYDNGDCSNDCIIPIRFYFAGVQETTISNLILNYTSRGFDYPESNIYDIEETSVLINSEFIKLNLEDSNLSAPTSFGKTNLSLKLDDKEIFSQEIDIKALPRIIDLTTKNIPALVPFPITAVLDSTATNLTFIWDFGDGEKETSNSSTIEHTYEETGTYTIKITIANPFANLTKSFSVVVGSPKNYINGTIIDYRNNIKDIESEINKLPGWIKTKIEKKLDFESLTASINSLEKRYQDAFEPNEYTLVMKELLALEAPNEFKISQTISPLDFFPNEEQLDLETLENLGAGTADETREIYANAANNWIRQNLRFLLESKTYSVYFNGLEYPIYSYLKAELEPSGTLDEFYFIINGNPNDIYLNGEFNSRDIGEVALGITFQDLSEKKTLEFLYPGRVDKSNLPIYVSPEFKNLNIGAIPGPCNNNDICEPGEDYKNCRNDCKPLGWTVFWLFILFFIAFVIYIGLQEWYKRHYESKLFPNKSQLFNLVNFMSISLNQGISKGDIYDKLKDLDWQNEQLNYVWNKLHGKRTGMWEIPIFKWIENRQVKRELEKRQGFQGDKGIQGFRSK